MSHDIRDSKVTLSKRDFIRMAKKHVGILLSPFRGWVQKYESSEGDGSAWNSMSIKRRNLVVKEFFDLYL